MSVLDKTLLTTVGAAKYAYNDANTLPTEFAEIALGDNNGAAFIPSITDGDCVNEVYRANINSITIDPADSTIVILQLVLPAAVGGFTVREARVYDADGVVMYTANPYFIKSIDSSDQNLLFRIKRSATSSVTLLVDPSITLASHTYVLNALEEYATKAGVQTNIYNHVTAGGTSDAITATYSPAYAAWVDGMTFYTKITAANTTTTPTVSPNGLTAKTIVKGAGAAVSVGDLQIGMIAEFKYSSTLDKVLLQNPSIPSLATQTGTLGSFKNIRCTIAVTLATATFTVDEIALGSGYGSAQFRVSGVSKTINLATTGVDGMDTGSPPVTGFVAVYVIYNPSTGAVGLLGKDTTGATATEYYSGANMPAGYVASALISIWRITASKFVTGNQYDRLILQQATLIVSVATAVTFPTAVAATSVIPKNAKTAELSFSLTSAGASNLVLQRSSNSAGTINSINHSVGATGNTLMKHEGAFAYNFITDQTIYYGFQFAPTGTLNMYILNYSF